MTVSVHVHSVDGERVVVVNEAYNDLHARLAAYYYVFGVEHTPSREEVIEATTSHLTNGPVNAKIYRNHLQTYGEDI